MTDIADASADAIVHEVVYPFPIERVWRALTERAALAEWLMPNDFAPQIGHRFTFRTAAEQGWNGVVECEVVALEPPRRVAYTWRSAPQLPASLVTFTLEPAAAGTRLRLEHTGFAALGEAGAALRDILGNGWGTKLLRTLLPALLERWQAEDEATKGRHR